MEVPSDDLVGAGVDSLRNYLVVEDILNQEEVEHIDRAADNLEGDRTDRGADNLEMPQVGVDHNSPVVQDEVGTPHLEAAAGWVESSQNSGQDNLDNFHAGRQTEGSLGAEGADKVIPRAVGARDRANFRRCVARKGLNAVVPSEVDLNAGIGPDLLIPVVAVEMERFFVEMEQMCAGAVEKLRAVGDRSVDAVGVVSVG